MYTAAFCVAYKQEFWIESWIRSVCPQVDLALVMWSSRPWNYNQQARESARPYQEDETYFLVSQAQYEFKNLVLVSGNWETEEEERNEAIRIANKRGVEALWIVDCDEFYTAKAWDGIKAEVQATNFSFYYTFQHLAVGNPDWNVVTKGAFSLPYQPAVIRPDRAKFERARRPDVQDGLVVTKKDVLCYHFSYVVPALIQQKVHTFAHSGERDWNKWLKEIGGKGPGDAIRHPLDPNLWSHIAEGTIPHEIQGLLPQLFTNPQS